MVLLALLLTAIGTADLFRPTDRTAGRAEAVRSIIAGTIAAVLVGWGCGLPWVWIGMAALLVCVWVLVTPSITSTLSAYPWPIVGIGLLGVAALAADPLVRAPHGWLVDWYAAQTLPAIAGVGFSHFLLGVGAILFLIESANVIVRMVLNGTDNLAFQSDTAPKGGRVLGPIERIFIFALALSGQLLAISAVVAAKGILRFPEITSDATGTKAEYVLVGSFVSWGLALVLVPLF